MVDRGNGRRVVTSVDVAREAQVSQSTVSYVMTGRRSISEETRRKVEDAMERLGYHPNSRAQGLAGRRTNVLGIVIPFRAGMDREVILTFVGEIATAARRHGLDILLITADEGALGLQRLEGTVMCDAMIIMDVEARDERLPIARNLGVPVVLIGVPEDDHGLSCVDLDFEAAGALSLDELADLGHRTVGLISPSTEDLRRDTNFVRRFRRGVEDAAGRRGVTVTTASAEATFASAAAAVDELWSASPTLTGLVVHNSHAVDSVTAALMDRGVRPGRDLAVVAVCMDETAERQFVSLTSIPLEPAKVSAIVVELLVGMLDPELPTQQIVRKVAPRLVRRDSTMPARD